MEREGDKKREEKGREKMDNQPVGRTNPKKATFSKLPGLSRRCDGILE
jgi:hypothetical protein